MPRPTRRLSHRDCSTPAHLIIQVELRFLPAFSKKTPRRVGRETRTRAFCQCGRHSGWQCRVTVHTEPEAYRACRASESESALDRDFPVRVKLRLIILACHDAAAPSPSSESGSFSLSRSSGCRSGCAYSESADAVTVARPGDDSESVTAAGRPTVTGPGGRRDHHHDDHHRVGLSQSTSLR